MRARGRNGYFEPKEVVVARKNSTKVRVSIYSKRLGNNPPIMLEGKTQEIMDLVDELQTILLDLNGCLDGDSMSISLTK